MSPAISASSMPVRRNEFERISALIDILKSPFNGAIATSNVLEIGPAECAFTHTPLPHGAKTSHFALNPREHA
jgi:hypothetical protein